MFLCVCVCRGDWASEKLSGRVQLEGHLPRWQVLQNFSFQPWNTEESRQIQCPVTQTSEKIDSETLKLYEFTIYLVKELPIKFEDLRDAKDHTFSQLMTYLYTYFSLNFTAKLDCVYFVNFQRPCVCPHEGCQKSFVRAVHLKRHLLSHDGEKVFK